MQRINLKHHTRSETHYNRDRDMTTALAWNALEKTLKQINREDLFACVTSIKITEKSIIIMTARPIINTEFQFYKELIFTNISETLKALTPQIPSRLYFR